MTALKSGLRECPLRFSLKKKYPKTWSEMLARAEKYANAEEESDTPSEPKVSKEKGKLEAPRMKEPRDTLPRQDRTRSPPRNRRHRSPPRNRVGAAPLGRFNTYTPLNTTREAILMQVGARLPEPPRIRADPDHRRYPDSFCRYHRDYGHRTEDCIQLRDEIERFIREGGLTQYIQRAPPRNFQQRRPPQQQGHRPPQIPPRHQQPYAQPPQLPLERPADRVNPVAAPAEQPLPEARPPRAEIRMITRESSSSARPSVPKKQKVGAGNNLEISAEEAVDVQFPHNDPLVVSMNIDNCNVHRVLIDNGSAVNVLYLPAFTQMGYDLSQLDRTDIRVHGFVGGSITPEGTISLSIAVGTPPQCVTINTEFLVF